MGSRVLWVLLIILGIGLIALVLRHDQGTIAGIDASSFASLIILACLLVIVGGSLFTMFRQRLSEAFKAAFFWLLIVLVLLTGYTYRHDLKDAGERILSELIPGRAASRGSTVEISRGRGGEFQVGTDVNGARVPMMLDTGASAVVLTQEAAKAAGLPLALLSYDVNVDTANGRTRAAAVTLDRVSVGTITERAVPALIAQPGQLKTSLLGMSFLTRLERWEVRGDKLVMRGYP